MNQSTKIKWKEVVGSLVLSSLRFFSLRSPVRICYFLSLSLNLTTVNRVKNVVKFTVRVSGIYRV